MCSETSPRISFSNDLVQENEIQIEQGPQRDDTRLQESSSDFEFSICSNLLDHESSLADEIFADGMILPIQIHSHKHEFSRKVSLPPLPCSSTTTSEDSRNSRKCAHITTTSTTTSENSRNSRKKEIMVLNSEFEEKTQSKSFWGFKRSSSLNDLKKSLIFSLPLLSRSNSTGSSIPNPKRPSSSQKKLLSGSSASSSTYVYTFPNNKPPLKKKNYGGSQSHCNGVKICPVLNVPPPYIAKGAANLFGLGSFLKNGKEKNRK